MFGEVPNIHSRLIINALSFAGEQIRSFRFGRLAQLWILSTIVLAYSVLEMAIANSLFLTKVGAGQLPQVFILIGLGSLPSYLIFSQIVDRFSRPKLFQFALGAAIVLALGLRALINLDVGWVFYLLMVVLFFQWDFHNTILYSSLLTDYFTATEYKKYAPTIGVGQAVGMLLGGVFTSVLPQFLSTEDLLYCVPVLMVLAIALLGWLEKSQMKLLATSRDHNAGIIESLKTFPQLVQKYPLILFLAGSSFLLVIIYLTSEFLWFSVYEQHFTSDELTQFLGLMRIGVSILQIVVLYCFTRPLLQWMGVSRMNVVYPITTLISLMSFLFKINLWTGIGLHFNGDGLFKSVNIPVHQLNYNAIPQEFIGRIRTISDGVFYSTGLMLVGVLLLFAHAHLNLTQITWIAVCLGILFLFLRVPMGKFYGAGLEDMMRANTIDLDALSEGSLLSREKTIFLIREWLCDSSLEIQYRALDLAKEVDVSLELLDDILRLQTYSDDGLRQRILAFFARSSDPKLDEQLKLLLCSELLAHRAIALEALIARRSEFRIDELNQFLNSDVSELQMLAAIAILFQAEDLELIHDATEHLHQPFSDSAGQALLRVTPYHFIPLLTDFILNRLNNSTQFAISGLKALTRLDFEPPPDAWRIIVEFLTHPEPQLRKVAYEYLGMHHPQQVIEFYALGFDDPDSTVRKTLATLVAQNLTQGLVLAQSELLSANTLRQETAIATLGKINNKKAQDCLYGYLSPDFQRLKKTRQWQKQIPTDESWAPLMIAIQDFQERLISKVFYILACLGNETTVNAVNYSLLNSSGRDRANAIEVLSSFKERRFIRPILPVLEFKRSARQPKDISIDEQWMVKKGLNILSEAVQDSDPWIKQCACVTLGNFPKAALNRLDPPIQKQLSRIQSAGVLSPKDSMTQIFLLKKVPIFQNLTLDELDLIGKELHLETVLAQQVIYSEGSWGQYFYVLESGTVELTKSIGVKSHSLKRIGAGDYFGEISVFDDAPHWDGAIALEDCTLLKLEKEKLKALMMQRPRISLEICRYLSQRLREFENFCGMQGQNI